LILGFCPRDDSSFSFWLGSTRICGVPPWLPPSSIFSEHVCRLPFFDRPPSAVGLYEGLKYPQPLGLFAASFSMIDPSVVSGPPTFEYPPYSSPVPTLHHRLVSPLRRPPPCPSLSRLLPPGVLLFPFPRLPFAVTLPPPFRHPPPPVPHLPFRASTLGFAPRDSFPIGLCCP